MTPLFTYYICLCSKRHYLNTYSHKLANTNVHSRRQQSRLVRTDEHFIEKYTDRPPVAFTTIESTAALRLENLGRYVVRGTNCRVRPHHAVLDINTSQIIVPQMRNRLQLISEQLFTGPVTWKYLPLNLCSPKNPPVKPGLHTLIWELTKLMTD